MKILGIGGTTHDYSYCVMNDENILIAIEEERISREKHSQGLRSKLHRGIQYCLQNNDLIQNYDDINLIISNDAFDLNHNVESKIIDRMVKINHHMAHAASTFYLSPFKESAILVMDGGGSYFSQRFNESCSLGYAQNNNISFFQKIYGKVRNLYNIEIFKDELNTVEQIFESNSCSIPLLYLLMTEACGFKTLQEGKTMGLAPYGKDTYVKMFSDYMVVVEENNKINIDIDYMGLVNCLQEIARYDQRDRFVVKADIAYATQHNFEQAVFFVMNYLHKKTGSKNLCFSGGAALNSVLNGKIKYNTKFENVCIIPAPADSGTAIGAALYGYYNIYGNKRRNYEPLKNMFYGKSYNDDEVEKVIDSFQNKVQFSKYDESELYKRTAQYISEGKIIGWFQGGSEFGPRALGNRSILADPRNKDMKDILNKKVKFREHFRPFAPVVLRSQVHDYFDTDFPDNDFMLFVGHVKEHAKKLIPAVTHIDGSARLQTVTENSNLKLFRLLEEFKEITGIPVLINTSFNIKGRPIVEKPMHAMEAFMHCEMDILVLNNYIISKK